jgi:hypothetical protein
VSSCAPCKVRGRLILTKVIRGWPYIVGWLYIVTSLEASGCHSVGCIYECRDFRAFSCARREFEPPAKRPSSARTKPWPWPIRSYSIPERVFWSASMAHWNFGSWIALVKPFRFRRMVKR